MTNSVRRCRMRGLPRTPASFRSATLEAGVHAVTDRRAAHARLALDRLEGRIVSRLRAVDHKTAMDEDLSTASARGRLVPL